MNTREKFSYMAFGAALMFLGVLLTLISPLTAQRDRFGEIVCTKLIVVDPITGKTHATIQGAEHGGDISVHSNDGLRVARLQVLEDGRGSVMARNKAGGLAVLHAKDLGGTVTIVGNPDGEYWDSEVGMGYTPWGGYIKVTNKPNSKGAITMFIDRDGNGTVLTTDKNGN
jgi:hypothetical protein